MEGEKAARWGTDCLRIGSVHIKALFATSQKLIRVVFAMLSEKTPFREEVVYE